MFTDRDLRKLAEMSVPKRFFLSVYLAGRHSSASLAGLFREIWRLLPEGEEGREDREQLEENVKAVKEYLDNNPLVSASLCLFSCQTLSFFRAMPSPFPVKDLVRVDTTPYIRPLAELKDSCEGVAVIVVDNKKARIFLVYSEQLLLTGAEFYFADSIKSLADAGGVAALLRN